MTSTPASLRQVVAVRLREHREGLISLTQDDVARAAQRLGFDWGRSSVAAIEAGERDLSGAELLALPYILDEAIRVAVPGARIGYRVSLAELLRPGRTEVLALSDTLTMTRKQVDGWLEGAHPELNPRRLDTETVGEAEQKAARSLGVTVSTLSSMTNKAWGHSLTVERDARLADRDDVTPQTRGHVTRQLVSELRQQQKGRR
jgi:hypothetical protein